MSAQKSTPSERASCRLAGESDRFLEACLDRGDICEGASAASSRLIHGGIKYLETGEFRLVRESVQERNDLLRTAPHVVKPLKTTVPIFSLTSGLLQAPLKMVNHGKGKRTERGALLIGVGLAIYETFSRVNGVMPRFNFVGRKRAAATLPSLHKKVKYVASYYDASVHEPERLAMDLIADQRMGRRAEAAPIVPESSHVLASALLMLSGCAASRITTDATIVTASVSAVAQVSAPANLRSLTSTARSAPSSRQRRSAARSRSRRPARSATTASSTRATRGRCSDRKSVV